MLIAWDGKAPRVHEEAFVAPSADLIGDVHVGRWASIWYQVVLRGDQNRIEIGDETNVQDGVVIHCDPDGYPGFPVVVGRGVTIGHGARLHGCRVDDGALIGQGAIVLDGAHVGSECLVAAGTLIASNVIIPPRTLIRGLPGKVARELRPDEIEKLRGARDVYLGLSARARLAHPGAASGPRSHE
jgi:carbonic anhydrase/acetyltransferase-like protein (isoleucine patch superfamily)